MNEVKKSPLDSFSKDTVKEVPQQESRPMTIMTEADAYIAERMKGQPQRLSDIEVTTHEERVGIHRLSLPDYFEPLSYDCTQGNSCPQHGWRSEKVQYGIDMEMDRWIQSRHGKYIFRWLNKNKRALDHSVNVRGWYLANRSYFSDAPKILFSVNGGIENGDSILGFMPVSKALAIRSKPSEISQDRVKAEDGKHEGHPNFYKAKISPDKEGIDDAPIGALQEGRDFNV